MEEEEHSSETTNNQTVVGNPTSPKGSNEEDIVSLEKTIHIENSSLKTAPAEQLDAVNPVSDNIENKKKKVKEEKPHSKIVVRRLPPTMSKEMFLEQVSPLPEVDYMYYIQGDVNNGINPYSRAYLNFISQEDLFSFSRTFDNYVFLDAKGQEYPAVVEFAMFQRVPKQRPKKKDTLIGTIESDPTFITFKENLQAEALESSKTGGKAVKQHYFETEISTAEEVNTTPLLEFLKVRRAEKARVREERREEKKRKELERKLKQKTKDKKGDGEEEESPKESKIHHKLSENHEKETFVERNKQIGESVKLGKNGESFERSKSDDAKKENSIKTILSQNQKISILVKTDKDKYTNESESQNKGNSTSNGGAVESNGDISSSGETNSVPDAEVQKIKEAEQQTMYLRKLLGLLPSENQLPATNKEVSAKSNAKSSVNDDFASSIKNVCIPEQLKKATEPPEVVLSAFKENISVNVSTNIFWSKNNVNPALPSASFKTSNSSLQELPAEQRSLSAPREWNESELSIKGASSTPNVSLIQHNHNPQGSLHVTRLLRKNSLESSTETSDQNGEEVQTKEKRENKERESRSVKKKDEKDRVKDTRVREFKSRGGKSYQEERLRLAERREEQKKRELLNSGEKKSDNPDPGETADSGEVTGEQSKLSEEKTSKFEKKKYDYRKKYDDDWKDEKRRNRNEKNNIKRDGRDRKDDYRRNQEKRISDSDLRRKVKTFKNSDYSKSIEDKKKFPSAAHEQVEEKSEDSAKNKIDKKEEDIAKDKWKSVDDLVLISTVERKKSDNILADSNDCSTSSKKRSSSLENLRLEERVPEAPPKKVTLLQREKPETKENKESSSSSKKDLPSHKSNSEYRTYSKKKDRFYSKNEESSEPSSKSKSQELEGDNMRAKDAPRSDRRIRNKDRPSIEIYRPGMGKFSKQRLEKEKALGSSTEVDSPSHSPSPTPKTKIVT